jgi:hypothetical protein
MLTPLPRLRDSQSLAREAVNRASKLPGLTA